MKKGIKRKLIIAFLLVAIIPLLTLGFFSYYHSYKETENSMSKYSLETVRKSMESIDFILERTEQDSIQIVTNSIVQMGMLNYGYLSSIEREEWNRNIITILRNMYNSRDNIVNIEIMFKNIPLLISASLEETIDQVENYQTSDANIEALKADGLGVWIGSRIRDQISGKIWNIENKYIYEYSRCIKSIKNMEQLGVVNLILQEVALEKMYEELIEDTEDQAFIIDKNNTIISHTDKDLIGKKYENIFMKNILEGDRSGVFHSEMDNEDVLISYAQSSINGWYLIKITPYTKITKQANQVTYIVLVIAIISTLLAIIFSVVFSASISKPIIQIAHSMYKIKEGNFNEKIYIKNEDEIGFLADNFNDMTDKIEKLIIDIKFEQKMKREAEFKELQAKISPHFLFNLINSLKFYAMTKNENQIVKLTDNLIKLLRISFDLNELITIREEISLIKSFIALQEFELNVTLNISYGIDENLYDCKILKFLIQPLVENAIIHGIDIFSGKGHIKILIKEDDNDILIYVIDNGKGFDANKVSSKKFSSFAIKNISERISLYFGEPYGLKIDSVKDKGTTVTIIIPKKDDGECDG